jgi:hypothetical protein
VISSKEEIALPNRNRYWELSRQPWMSLVFIAPMLVAYEVGVLALGRGAPRNGADVWLRSFLDLIGFGQYFLLPLLTCGILLGWQYLTRQPWTIHRRVLGIMWLEALAFGLLLLAIANLHGSIFGRLSNSVTGEIAAAAGGSPRSLTHLVGYLGAGIYEELLFRLMLLPVAIAGLKACSLKNDASVIGGIVLVSLLFSAVHYRMPFFGSGYGDEWSFYSFTFRFLAGVFFAILFQVRGFGIAAGSHAIYDILVGLMAR